MQINSANFARLGVTPETVFDPCTNLRAGARLLADNYGRAHIAGHADPLRAALSEYNTGSRSRGLMNGYVGKVFVAANGGAVMRPLVARSSGAVVTADQVGGILVSTFGGRINARYEIYAHEIMGEVAGLSASQVATLAIGGRPADLCPEEEIAHDVANALTRGRTLPASTYERAVDLLGLDGLGELTFLIGGYCLISMALNSFDAPVPDVGMPAQATTEGISHATSG